MLESLSRVWLIERFGCTVNAFSLLRKKNLLAASIIELVVNGFFLT